MNKHELIYNIGIYILDKKDLGYVDQEKMIKDIMEKFNVDFDKLKNILEYLFSYGNYKSYMAESKSVSELAFRINDFCFDANLVEDIIYNVYNIKYLKYNIDKITEEELEDVKKAYKVIIGQALFDLDILSFTEHHLWYLAEKLSVLEEKLDKDFVEKTKSEYCNYRLNYRIYDSSYCIYTYMELEDIVEELKSEMEKLSKAVKKFKKHEDKDENMVYTYSSGTQFLFDSIVKISETAEVVKAEKVYEEISALDI